MSQLVEVIEKTPPLSKVSRPRVADIWKAAVICLMVLILYWPVLTKLVNDWWNDPNFSHGFLVPLFSGFLLWSKRETLAKLRPRPSWWGLPIVLFALFLLFVGTFGIELFLPRASLVFLLAGLVILFFGWRMFRELAFPWACLFLMIPIPAILFNQVTFPLQLLASKVASEFLPILGVPVLREGNIIQLPSMPLEVAEACSGIRSLISLTTLAIIYGYFLDSNPWRRTILALSAIPIAVIANAARIVGTGLAVQYWDPEKALGFFHEFSGWVIFMISMLLLFAVHGVEKTVWRMWRNEREVAL